MITILSYAISKAKLNNKKPMNFVVVFIIACVNNRKMRKYLHKIIHCLISIMCPCVTIILHLLAIAVTYLEQLSGSLCQRQSVIYFTGLRCSFRNQVSF